MVKWDSKIVLLILAAFVFVGIIAAIYAIDNNDSGSLAEKITENVSLDTQTAINAVNVKEDVFKELKENNPKEGKAVFKMYSPTALSKDKLTFTFNEVCGKVKDYKLTILDTCYKDITHYNYTLKESCTNDTINNTYSCVNNSISSIDYIEHASYDCWKDVDSIPAGEKDYKINANIAMAKCADGNMGYQIDWIPSMQIDANKKFAMNDWAWWNVSYKYKMYTNLSGFLGSEYFYINGTSGININGVKLLVVARASSGNVSLYYNNETSLAVIENDTIVQDNSLMNLTGLTHYYYPSLTININAGTYQCQQFQANGKSINQISRWITNDGSASGYAQIMITNSTINSTDKVLYTANILNYNFNTIPNSFTEVRLNFTAFNGLVAGNLYWICVNNSAITGTYKTGSSGTNTNGYYSDGSAGIYPPTAPRYTYYYIGNYSFGYLYDNGPGHGDVVLITSINDDFYADESFGRAAILAGVQQSKIGSSYLPYPNQKVYERLVNGSQYPGTFDYVIVSGNKRYLFNYDQNTSSNFPEFYNMSPNIYVWQRSGMTSTNISQNVQSLIDSTYS